jgi:hypothetical protein
MTELMAWNAYARCMPSDHPQYCCTMSWRNGRFRNDERRVTVRQSKVPMIRVGTARHPVT